MTKYCLRYRIKTLAPILMTRVVASTNMLSTEKYLSGSALLGMFANHYRSTVKAKNELHKDDLFYRCFLSGGLHFTNAYITQEIERDEGPQTFYPVPLSFQKEKNAEELLDRLWDESDKATGNAGLEYVALADDDEVKLVHHTHVDTVLNFHHERNWQSGTALAGNFFNYEAIAAGQLFNGCILGSRETLESFLKIMKDFQSGRLGRSRTAQYGKIEFEWLNSEPEEFHGEIPNTAEKANDLQHNTVTITLLSDTIIYNKFGFSSTNPEDLGRYLKHLKIRKAFAKVGDTENFLAVWRLKKPSERCFAKGSTFEVEVPDDNGKAALLDLQVNGLGERRQEGFGRLVLDWQRAGKVSKVDSDQNDEESQEKNSVEKPDFPLPETAKETVKKIFSEAISKSVVAQALDTAQNFKKLPSKSLIGRLEQLAKTKNVADFRKDIKALRKTAKTQLEECHPKNSAVHSNLFDFLKSSYFNITSLLAEPHNTDLQKLLEDGIIEYDLEDAEFIEQLQKTYLKSFFALLRKLKKSEG